MQPRDVLQFWISEVGPAGWYAGGAELDARIRTRFESAWSEAARGAFSHWRTSSDGALALVILLDQFPRNMFRDSARAFSTDAAARAVAKALIDARRDRQVGEPERQFFYLPLMHAETVPDQERCVRLFATRMPETGGHNLLHARAHREVIRRFGRFPYRNAALGRASTPAEEAFLAAGGYGAVVRDLEALAG